MAKAKKEIVPFFKLRWQAQDTLEAVANEVLLTIQTIDMAIRMSPELKQPTKDALKERSDAWRKLCMEDEGE